MDQKIEKMALSAVVIFVGALMFFIARDVLFTSTNRTSIIVLPNRVATAAATTADVSATEIGGALWTVNGKSFTLVVASTSVEQELGLGDRASLASTSGMFFTFDTPDNYGFWMKDMEFSIDIIWLDQDYKIIHIEHDLSPNTYPQVYYPGSLAKYVIEVNSGTAAKFYLNVGQIMQIN